VRRRLLLVSAAAILALAAGCGGGDDEETADGGTPPPATETVSAGTGGEAAEGDAAAGKEVFMAAQCGTCHTLADARTSDVTGLAPNLDDLAPSFETVQRQVTNGGGGMPAFGGTLTEQQIADVAAYVSSVTGR
jgi:cytochrome c551